MKKPFFSIILFFLVFSGISNLAGNPISTQKADASEVWLTVIVHGILNVRPHISLSNIILVLCDNVENTIYSHSVDIIRNDPFFYQYHPMQKLGLEKIDLMDVGPGKASTAFARFYEELHSFNCKTPVKNVYYTFGWTGLLGTKIRTVDAHVFYLELLKEVNAYKAQGITPKIRVIGYSHGGHIALHLATVHKRQSSDTALEGIDEVVLIGLPVVCDSDYLVNSPLFKKVYHLYSPADRVQIADFLACPWFLSSRTFEPRHDFELPDKLIQIELRWKRLARTKRQYTYPNYPKWLIRNADPGHTELFSFGWLYNYRKHMPFYPLPIVCYIGYFLNAVAATMPTEKHISIDIRPFDHTMTFKTPTFNKPLVTPFLTSAQQQHFIDAIAPFIPLDFTVDAFNKQTAHTISLAKQRYEEYNRPVLK